mgnify:CR=1 FL=1
MNCECSAFQVTDLTLARENQSSFENYLSEHAQSHPGIDLTVTVLTTGFCCRDGMGINLDVIETWELLSGY